MLTQEAVHIGACATFAFCAGDMNDIQAINIFGLVSVSEFQVTKISHIHHAQGLVASLSYQGEVLTLSR